MGGRSFVLQHFLMFDPLALTSTRINAVNGAVAFVAISQRRCCANVPRLRARLSTLPPSENFDRLIWFYCVVLSFYPLRCIIGKYEPN